ncbi:MAG: DUF2207 domain-containing protein [Actinomycetota bacterium]
MGALWLAPAARAQIGEQISSYHETVRVQPDGTLDVTEEIAYDFGGTPHHGIFRDIPTAFRLDDTFDRVTPIEDVSVDATGGASSAFKVSTSDGVTTIKIGDADATVTGPHIYTIRYVVRGAINGFPDHAELYWNAVGPNWSVLISDARLTIIAPQIQKVACYQGPAGSQLSCDRIRHHDGDPSATFSADSLFPYQGLTGVISMPKGTVPATVLKRERWTFARAFSASPGPAGLAGGVLILLVGGFSLLAWRRGRDRVFIGSDVDTVLGGTAGDRPVPLGQADASAPVEFAPPEGLRPGQMGTLIDGQANTLDVTATIVDLAVRGFLRIEEIPHHGLFGKTDWNLVRLPGNEEALQPYETRLYGGLFDGAEQVTLSSLRTRFASKLKDVEEKLYVDAMKRRWFLVRPDKIRATWHALGWLVVAIGCVLTFVLARFTHLGLVGVAVIVSGVVVSFGGRFMPARSATGTAMLRRVRGFRTVIERCEEYTAKWAEQENVFTTFLPYAVVFGVTEKWAKTFEALGLPADTGWYVGQQPFTYLELGHALDGFAVSTGGTISSTPASSGSSGLGGGGGFSGGGMGGGGGGSW